MGKGVFMMRKILVSLFLVSILVFGFASVSSAANWQWITSTDNATIYFDTTSIKDKSTNKSDPNYSNLVYSVWVKWVYTDSEADNLAKKLNFTKPVAYSLYETDVDYKNKGMLVKSIYYYDNEGKSLWGGPLYSTEFKSIIPDSVGEVIYNTTLKEFNAQRNEQSGKSWKDYLK